jgi:CDP-diacylglycerol pyrophosphatase
MGLIVATVVGLPNSVSAANRSGLWAVVHDICLPAYQGIDVAFPCAEVNIANGLEQGFVVLQTPSSATHVLVVPTTRISGIESPALLSENAPNYWEAAWVARRFVEEGARRRLPRDKIGMAINSPASRSQDQLHSHVACVAPAGRCLPAPPPSGDSRGPVFPSLATYRAQIFGNESRDG